MNKQNFTKMVQKIKDFEDPFVLIKKAKELKKHLKEVNIVFDKKKAEELRINCGTQILLPIGEENVKNNNILTFFEMIDIWERTIVDHRLAQRPEGCWEPSRCRRYMESILKRNNLYLVSDMTLINIPMCKDYSYRMGDMESVEYYERWSLPGVQFSSCDGQHRAICLMDYIMNKFPIYRKGKKKFFNDLEEEDKCCILYGITRVNEQRKLLKKQIPDLFEFLNSSKTPTSAQKRHMRDNEGSVKVISELSSLREEILKIVEEFDEKNDKTYLCSSLSQVRQRKDEEFYQKLFIMKENILKNKTEDIRERSLNNLCIVRVFDDNERNILWIPFLNDIKKQIKSILECSKNNQNVEDCFFNSSHNSGGVLDLSVYRTYFLFETLIQSRFKKTIKDREKLVNYFVENIYMPLVLSSSYDEEGFKRSNNQKKEPHRYSFTFMVTDHSHKEYLNGVIRLMENQIHNSDFLIKNENECFISLDNKRLFSYQEKYECLKRQDFKCFDCRCHVDHLKPLTYQGGHIEAHSKGGKTILDNCIVLCVDCHKERTKDEFAGNKPRECKERGKPQFPKKKNITDENKIMIENEENVITRDKTL